MKERILSLVLGLLVFGSCSVVNGATNIIFQQGLGGYSGCQDSFVNTSNRREDDNINFGLNRFLILNTEHNSST